MSIRTYEKELLGLLDRLPVMEDSDGNIKGSIEDIKAYCRCEMAWNALNLRYNDEVEALLDALDAWHDLYTQAVNCKAKRAFARLDINGRYTLEEM